MEGTISRSATHRILRRQLITSFGSAAHPETGTVCSEGEGGVWKKESPTTSAKYLARGVCV